MEIQEEIHTYTQKETNTNTQQNIKKEIFKAILKKKKMNYLDSKQTPSCRSILEYPIITPDIYIQMIPVKGTKMFTDNYFILLFLGISLSFSLSICIYVWVPVEIKRRYHIPWIWVYRCLWAAWGWWILNSNPLKEQLALL